MRLDENTASIHGYLCSDGYVTKSKNPKDSVNFYGLRQIQESLRKLGIESSINYRKEKRIWNLAICGKDDLIKFQEKINFLHKTKSQKLKNAIESYVNYFWNVPKDRKDLIKFMKRKGRKNITRKEIRFNSIIKKNLKILKNNLSTFGVKSNLNGPWKNPYGSIWYCLSINFKEFNKLKGGKN